jgi:hypothetical protein
MMRLKEMKRDKIQNLSESINNIFQFFLNYQNYLSYS